jgi:hypothetical protein
MDVLLWLALPRGSCVSRVWLIEREVGWRRREYSYTFHFSGPVTALRARARAGARVKSKIDYPLSPLNSRVQSLLSINC